MQKNIFHIHDKCCKHSSNTLDKIISYALKYKYRNLYFTEHSYISINCPYQQRRPTLEDIKDLKNRIDLANKKYKKKLHIFFGYEIEFNKENVKYFKKIAKDPWIDFLIFGNHFYGDIFKMKNPLPLTKYYSTSLKNLKEFEINHHNAIKSKLFSWIAHPEIFLFSYRKWDKYSINLSKKIIKWSIQYKLPLGFNVNFPPPFESKDIWHYPVEKFWNLVSKTNIPVIIECDSHDIHTFQPKWLEKAKKLAIKYGLKNNLTENIILKK